MRFFPISLKLQREGILSSKWTELARHEWAQTKEAPDCVCLWWDPYTAPMCSSCRDIPAVMPVFHLQISASLLTLKKWLEPAQVSYSSLGHFYEILKCFFFCFFFPNFSCWLVGFCLGFWRTNFHIGTWTTRHLRPCQPELSRYNYFLRKYMKVIAVQEM